MIFTSRRNVLREKGGETEHKVAFVELFFDLVFVFAVTCVVRKGLRVSPDVLRCRRR